MPILCYFLKSRMDYQKNRPHRPRFKSNRPVGFHGYYVEVREGEDALRAFRKIKKKQKDDKFIEEIKDRQYFRKPSEISREKKKRRTQVIKKATKEAVDSRLMRVTRSR